MKQLYDVRSCRYCGKLIWWNKGMWHNKCVELYQYRESQDTMFKTSILQSHPDYPNMLYGIMRAEVIGYDEERLQVQYPAEPENTFWIPKPEPARKIKEE